MPTRGTPPPQTRLQCPVAGADQRGRHVDCAGCPRTDCSDGRICGGSGQKAVAQPSAGPNPARREPVCAGANANTEFSTEAARIHHRGASVVMMHRHRKTASSRVSGLLRTQRRCRWAFSLPPVRIWARRTAQTRSSGIFLENPAVFFYFWNETAGAETAGLSPTAAPGPVGCRSEHANTSWVCAQAVKNAQTAAFCMPNSVFCRHISEVFGVRLRRPPAGGRACCPTSGLF